MSAGVVEGGVPAGTLDAERGEELTVSAACPLGRESHAAESSQRLEGCRRRALAFPDRIVDSRPGGRSAPARAARMRLRGEQADVRARIRAAEEVNER